MADTGYNWAAAFSAMQKSAGDWTSDTIANGASESGDPTSMDGLAAKEIGITAVTANTAVSGVVNVYIRGTADGTNFEAVGDASYSMSFTPTQNTTTYHRVCRLLGSDFSEFVLTISNNSGASIDFTVEMRDATIPAAS